MPKTLLLDIETAPNKAYVWGLFDQNISPDQVVESGYILCWSAKWLGQSKRYSASCQHTSRQAMLQPIAGLLAEADIVVHYNGRKFDIPILNREFIKHKLSMPAPYKQIDLMWVVKAAFRFESNKLDYVAQTLGLGAKIRHSGFQMWVDCMEGKQKAWAEMIRYNHGDVALLESLYHRLLPWIEKHPNVALGAQACPKCGSTKYQSRGTTTAVTRTYQRFQCQKCGGWFRSTASIKGKSATMTNIGG